MSTNTYMTDFYLKYLKYKTKYIKLKGGATPCINDIMPAVHGVSDISGNDRQIYQQIFTMNDFIKRAKSISSHQKNKSEYIVPQNTINDMYTNKINQYFLTVPNLLVQYLINVMEIFGDFDISFLIPYVSKRHHEQYLNLVQSICNPNYETQDNPMLTEQNTGLKSYFVFKGGNVIKYWTLTKYIQKRYGNKSYNIQDLFNFKLEEYSSNLFNTFSDYDFQIYISGQSYNMDAYSIIIEHILRRLILLRIKLTHDLNVADGNYSIVKFTQEQTMNDEILNFFVQNGNIYRKNTSKDIKDIDVQILTDNNSQIITKYSPIDNKITTIFHIIEQEEIAISFNNTILTSTNCDFDICRFKLNFNANNNYKYSKFSSEIFDLTIQRPNPIDISRENFCKHIDEYTSIATVFDMNNVQFDIRLYSVLYLLKDLLDMLFVINFPHNSIFAWADVKYEKRLLRLGFVCALYLDELKQIASTKYGSNCTFKEIIIEANRAVINNDDNDIFYQFIKNWYIGLVVVLISIYLNSEKPKLEVGKQLIFDKMIDFIFRLLDKIQKSVNMPQELSDKINQTIRDIIDMYSRQELDIINIGQLTNNITNHNFFEFILGVNILYIKAIYIDENIEWCSTRYHNDGIMIDIAEFKTHDMFFMTHFTEYYLTGLECLTDLLSEFCTDNVILAFNDLQGGLITLSKIEQHVHETPIKSNITVPKTINTELHNKKAQIFINNLNNYITYGIKNKLYIRDKSRTYKLVVAHNSTTYKLTIIPKLINNDIYNNDLLFDKIVAEQNKLMAEIIQMSR